ncbi:MAG: sugar ABC transporter permease [Spirochaetales bacterium]|nr:sugar ABC transporter permease [Spirochaetales bacterium]
MKSPRCNKKQLHEFRYDLLYIGPILFVYTLLFTFPFFDGIRLSLSSWDGVSSSINFIGFRNYIDMFTKDEYFLPSIMRTLIIAVLNVILTNVLAMLFALSLTTKFRANNIYRAAIFMPNVISMVVSGFIWKFMFTQIAPTIAEQTGISWIASSWLGNPDIVVYSIVIVSVWWGLGYIMTIYIAGIQGIDKSLIEAGDIDGCSQWQSFWKIKLPSMLPVVSVGIFLNVAGSLKIFDVIYSLTGGGPGKSSEVVMLNLYREAFVYQHFGMGTAKAIVLTLMVILITIIERKVTEGEEL